MKKREGHGPTAECKSPYYSTLLYSYTFPRKFLKSELNKKVEEDRSGDFGLIEEPEHNAERSEDEDDGDEDYDDYDSD